MTATSQDRLGAGVRCMLLRGGSSKGAYFLASDLPTDEADRDEVLLRIMGTPDPRQIDGLGGAHPLTSKVAIVSPSEVHGIDVDYLFLQVGVAERMVTDRQTCGNLLAGVGPFAVERGLVTSTGPEAEVRLRLVNIDAVATASFPTVDGRPSYSGPATIAGVPGTSAPVRLVFEDVAGGTTGGLLPSGATVDLIDGVPCTLVDNGMPVVVLRAADLGVTGDEAPAELEGDSSLRARLERIRVAAAELMGLGDVSESTIPKLTLVAPPRHGGTLATRTFIPHRCHDAIGVFGAMSVAVAAVLPETVASELTVPGESPGIVLEHPSGSLTTLVDIVQGPDGTPVSSRAGIVSTARQIMDGVVFPRDYA